jgi:hypothetical protein
LKAKLAGYAFIDPIKSCTTAPTPYATAAQAVPNINVSEPAASQCVEVLWMITTSIKGLVE